MPHYSDQGGFPGSVLRDGDWKLIENLDSGQSELFNLALDPAGARDLAAQRPDVAARLQEPLRSWQQ